MNSVTFHFVFPKCWPLNRINENAYYIDAFFAFYNELFAKTNKNNV